MMKTRKAQEIGDVFLYYLIVNSLLVLNTLKIITIEAAICCQFN